MSVGATVGKYVLGEPIGAGGMGVVYDVTRPTSSGRRVAIKMLYRESQFDDLAIRRFRNEAIAGRIVRHPNVMGVLEGGETDDGLPYLVLEHVAGERLAERIDREGPVLLRTALAIVSQVLAGLDAIHSAGIVHGDIKSDNILVHGGTDGSDVAKLIDFGLARPYFSLHDDLDTSDLDVVSGTPDYMAPEVIVGEQPSYRSDIYAVGIVLYEMLTGLTPFGGGTSDEILHRHLDDDLVLPSLRMMVPCPPLLDRIVARALEKDPAWRFATARAFGSAIAIALRSLVDEPARRPHTTQTVRREDPTVEWRAESRRARSHG